MLCPAVRAKADPFAVDLSNLGLDTGFQIERMPGGSTLVSLETFERDSIDPQKVGYFLVAPAKPPVITPASNNAFGGTNFGQ
jgi:hypothetical protein